jgi:four helix bundle protein
LVNRERKRKERLIVIGFSLAVGEKVGRPRSLVENHTEERKKNKRSFRSFEELECWKACTEVRRFITQLPRAYPKDEKFGLTSDMKRAARSTTHNIAEGFGRYHFQENIQFCRVSRGSLCELIDQLITSKDEGFITGPEYEKGRELISTALRPLNGYINSLARQKSEFCPPMKEVFRKHR